MPSGRNKPKTGQFWTFFNDVQAIGSDVEQEFGLTPNKPGQNVTLNPNLRHFVTFQWIRIAGVLGQTHWFNLIAGCHCLK